MQFGEPFTAVVCARTTGGVVHVRSSCSQSTPTVAAEFFATVASTATRSPVNVPAATEAASAAFRSEVAVLQAADRAIGSETADRGLPPEVGFGVTQCENPVTPLGPVETRCRTVSS